MCTSSFINLTDFTMSVKIESGKWTTIWRKKKVSTAFVQNSLVSLDDGFVTPADTTTGAAGEPVLGVYGGPAIAVGSATTVEIPVFVPIGPATIRCTASGALATTDEGLGFDMASDVIVDEAQNTYKAVTLLRYIGASEGIFMISKSMYANVA